MVKRGKQFLNYRGRFLFRELTSILDDVLTTIKQVATLTHLHDNIDVCAVFISFKVLNDVWMIDCLHDSDFYS
jgi:acetate kinase